ncbi:tubby-like F-box protein 3 [Impatiens glandulifera]|uniref:tubby-like F-box protein 3 n=1 Tax=Impatiens glandulifera TaxID=253017 RepID=UPI001FB16F56|nr:tubby-like F-box protein 3 [Impatiens glandulifera]XP_047334624.1 tubby-like F-box protein 3 [Impatiens glandulifera]XP_047334625.1 tubby-like F-box protein 3 [Impatiens glandulifera]
MSKMGMKSESGRHSKRGFSLRSRSLRTFEEIPVTLREDGLKESSWANIPPEILREVLKKIESSQTTWPLRQNVVSCAGVCKGWRDMMKDIVKIPQLSGKLTFPISLKQPGPRNNTLIHCYIKRNSSNQTYYLYLNLHEASNEDGKFLLAAKKYRRPTCNDYIISLNSTGISKEGNSYIGKLRSNFLGTKFTIYDALPPNNEVKVAKSLSTRLLGIKRVSPTAPVGNYSIGCISYGLNALGSRGPRSMQCTMDSIPASSIEPRGVAPIQTEFPRTNFESYPSPLPFFRSKSTRTEAIQSEKEKMLFMKNKSPKWHDRLQCWCLNFNGRVTVASVKNFQLVAYSEGDRDGEGEGGGVEHEDVILQFGKVGKDLFTMDYQYPISAFQAFAICISSFETMIACE